MKNILDYRLTRRFLSVFISVGILTTLVIANAGIAFATTGPSTVTPSNPVNAGPLTFTPGTIAYGDTYVSTNLAGGSSLQGTTNPITLDGKKHTFYIAIPIELNDATGTGAGWKVNLSATRPTTTVGAATYQLTNMPIIAGYDTVKTADTTSSWLKGTSYAAGIGSSSILVDPTVTPGTETTLLSTDITGSPAGTYIDNGVTHGFGMGDYTTIVVFQQDIAAQDYANIGGGAYTSTFTFDITTGGV